MKYFFSRILPRIPYCICYHASLSSSGVTFPNTVIVFHNVGIFRCIGQIFCRMSLNLSQSDFFPPHDQTEIIGFWEKEHRRGILLYHMTSRIHTISVTSFFLLRLNCLLRQWSSDLSTLQFFSPTLLLHIVIFERMLLCISHI